ncbi:FUSC family protein [Streptomyces sp. NBC_01497]|uniref:FUSC family protein n=1 Tax=Streptomyces sp. NBC_01497 TaxID=2903885 RepID=UPI002E35955D|nr:FUSC family protein [Streptomyces sp. NBC_01497]
MNLLRHLRARDAGFAALRRGGRAAIVAPGLFALCVEVLGNETMGLFAAFGSIALLLFVDFGGPVRDRLAAQSALVCAGAVLVSLGTLASGAPWPAAIATVVVTFGILFSGIISSTVAGASTTMLISFILPVTLPGAPGTVPDRLAGWGLAGAASLVAVGVLWPAPARDPLRTTAARACAALAERLRAEVACVRGGFAAADREALDAVVSDAEAAVAKLRTTFFGTPYRPTGLSTATRTLVRLVDEVMWLQTVLMRTPLDRGPGPADAVVHAVRLAAADLLEQGAERLRTPDGSAPGALDAAMRRLDEARAVMERTVTAARPGDRTGTDGPPAVTTRERSSAVAVFVSCLEPSFRAQETSFAIRAIAENIELTLAARRRSWWQRLAGRRPAGVESPLASAQERAGAHVERHSVWLHNSVRGSISLGLAVLVAALTGVEHSFWVAFGTMAVLRSSALLTGQNSLRAVAGTAAGIAIGGAVIYGVGSDQTALWLLLPLAVLFTGLAPSAISFAAGQAGFTASILILFTIIQPAGWSIGLVRIEDVAIGCAVSVAVGVLFWPRGAGDALGEALADAFTHSARYVRGAIGYGVTRCDVLAPTAPAPEDERSRAAAAARRLDDAFRGFLAERGTKHVPLADVTALITAVAVLRLTGDAVLDLWGRDHRGPAGDRTAARREIDAAADALVTWFESVAGALTGHGPVPGPLPHDAAAADRLLGTVRQDLAGDDRGWSATAIRMIWTADHIRAVRSVQSTILEPSRLIAARQRARRSATARIVSRRATPGAGGPR